MTPAQAREAHEYLLITLPRIKENYVKNYSGRMYGGVMSFPNAVSRREYTALENLSKIAERLTPESFAALLNGQGVWIEGEPKQEKILGYSVHEAQARERDKQAKLDWELLG
jgi:hypothetical protein